jgi:hypothetical protein
VVELPVRLRARRDRRSGCGTERALLLVEARGHVFLAPDNGLLAPLIASEPLVTVRKVGASAPVRGRARPSTAATASRRSPRAWSRAIRRRPSARP